jgi:Zn-dependent protease with chaperone function
MAAQDVPAVYCSNGHGPFAPGSQFCTSCGMRLAAFAAPIAGPPVGPPPPVPGVPPVIGGPVVPVACPACGGDPERLQAGVVVCPACNRLRPLAPGYAVNPAAFQWAQDGAAMAKLRGIGPINTAARAVSDRVGRRWIEAAFNAVRLSDRQLPAVYANAVLAARILGMPMMPDVYVSGDRMWDSATYGSENSAFIILGTALLTNYQGADQLFLLAREMGHCRAGHALWKTVIRFLLGEQGPRHGLGGAGVLAALNPAQLVEGALELPLLAWARQAEITADRAGLLAVGDEDVARRVLLSWSLRSVMLYRQINIETWLQQMDDSDEQTTRLSEVASSSTPYITRRLKLLAGFAASPELKQYRSVIAPLLPAIPAAAAAPPAAGSPSGPPSVTAARPQAGPPQESDDLRLACPACKAAMRIPRAVLAGRDTLNVRCANPACGKVTTLKKQAVPALSLQAPPQAVETESSMDSSS